VISLCPVKGAVVWLQSKLDTDFTGFFLCIVSIPVGKGKVKCGMWNVDWRMQKRKGDRRVWYDTIYYLHWKTDRQAASLI